MVRAAQALGVPVRRVAAEELARGLAPGVQSQGVVLVAGPLPTLPLPALARMGSSPRTLVALDGLEDPGNVGAIARAAEACGAQGLILTRRRSSPLSPAVARASAGAVEWLAASRVPNLPRALNDLKENGFWVFGSDPEAPEELFELPERLLRGDRVVVFGAEGRGLRRGVVKVLDHRVRIPMDGEVASLNAGSAAAVVLYELRRRTRLAAEVQLSYL